MKLKLSHFFLITAFAVCAVTSEEKLKCASKCSGEKTFYFEPQKTYIYFVHTRLRIKSGVDVSDLEYKGDVRIQSLGNCEYSLQLQQVNGHKELLHYKEDLENEVLKFSYDNGIIENVCPTNDEQQWSLNVKKAILSALQTSSEFVPTFKIVLERDFLGDCETEYSSQESKEEEIQYHTIIKRKQLSKCRNHVRSKIAFIPPGILSTGKEFAPFVTSSHNCTQKVDVKGFILDVVCNEETMTNIGSSESAYTSSTLNIFFKSIKDSVSSVEDSNRRIESLLPAKNYDKKISLERVESALTHYCFSTAESLSAESPKRFRKLVSALQDFDYTQIKLLIEMYGLDGCKLSSKTTVYKDLLYYAILMSGGKGAIRYLTENLDQISTADPRDVATLFSLPFLNQPSEETVKALLPFIRKSNNARLTIFASALIGNFIRQNNVSGDNVNAVRDAVNLIINKLPEACRKSGGSRSDEIIILRSLGNIGYLTDNAIQKVIECGRSSHNDEVYSTVLDTISRTKSCNNARVGETVYKHLTEVLDNKQSSTEVLIASLNALMTCNANLTEYELIKKVYDLMERDGVEQFSQYTRSYLSHLKKSTAPEFSHLRHALNHLTSFGYPDATKGSRKVGKSFYMKQLNLGVDLVIDYIYDEGSDIPKVIKFAFNIPAHDKTIHLFEIGLRINGEKLHLKDFSLITSLLQKTLIKYLAGFTTEREFMKVDYNQIKEDFVNFLKTTKLFSVYINYNDNTLIYLSANDLDASRNKREAVFFPIISEVINSFIPFTLKQNMFYALNLLDVYVERPTITGFTVRKYAQSSALIAFRQMKEWKGKFEFGKEAMFSLFPHFAVDVNYGIKTVFERIEFGVESEYKINSNLGFKVKQTNLTEKNRVVTQELDLRLPSRQMELFHCSWKKDTIESPEILGLQVYKQACHAEWLAKSVGLFFCEEHRNLVRNDQVKGSVHQYIVSTSIAITHWKLRMVTSQKEFSVLVKAMSDKENRELKYSHHVETHRNKFKAEFTLQTQEKGLKLFVERQIEGKYNFKINLNSTSVETKTESRLLNLDFVFENVKRNRRSTEPKIRSYLALQIGNSKLQDYFALEANVAKNSFLSVDTAMEYKRKGVPNIEKVKLHGKIYDKGVGDTIHREISGEASFTQYPQYDYNFRGKAFYKPKEIMDNEFVVKFDKNTNDERKQIRITQFYNFTCDEYKESINGYSIVKIGPTDTNWNISHTSDNFSKIKLNFHHHVNVINMKTQKVMYDAFFSIFVSSWSPLEDARYTVMFSDDKHQYIQSLHIENEKSNQYVTNLLFSKNKLGESDDERLGYAVEDRTFVSENKTYFQSVTVVKAAGSNEKVGNFKFILDTGENILNRIDTDLIYKDDKIYEFNHYFSRRDSTLKSKFWSKNGEISIDYRKTPIGFRNLHLHAECKPHQALHDTQLTVNQKSEVSLISETNARNSFRFKIDASRRSDGKIWFAVNTDAMNANIEREANYTTKIWRFDFKKNSFEHNSSLILKENHFSFETRTKDLFNGEIRIKDHSLSVLKLEYEKVGQISYQIIDDGKRKLYSFLASDHINSSLLRMELKRSRMSDYFEISSEMKLKAKKIYYLKSSASLFREGNIPSSAFLLLKALEKEIAFHYDYVGYKDIDAGISFKSENVGYLFKGGMHRYNGVFLQLQHTIESKVIYGFEHFIGRDKRWWWLTDVTTPEFSASWRFDEKVKKNETKDYFRLSVKKKNSDFIHETYWTDNRKGGFIISTTTVGGKIFFLLNSTNVFEAHNRIWILTSDNKWFEGSITHEYFRWSPKNNGTITFDLMAKSNMKRRFAEIQYKKEKDEITLNVVAKLNPNVYPDKQYTAKAVLPTTYHKVSQITFESKDPENCESKFAYKPSEEIDKKFKIDLDYICENHYKMMYNRSNLELKTYQHNFAFTKDKKALFSFTLKNKYNATENRYFSDELISCRVSVKSIEKSWNGVYFDYSHHRPERRYDQIRMKMKPPYLDKEFRLIIDSKDKHNKDWFLAHLLEAKFEIDTLNSLEKRNLNFLFDFDRIGEITTHYYYEHNHKKDLLFLWKFVYDKSYDFLIEYKPTSTLFNFHFLMNTTVDDVRVKVVHDSFDWFHMNQTRMREPEYPHKWIDAKLSGNYFGFPVKGFVSRRENECKLDVKVKPLIASYPFPKKLRFTDCFEPSNEDCFVLSFHYNSKSKEIVYIMRTGIDYGTKFPLNVEYKKTDREKLTTIQMGRQKYGVLSMAAFIDELQVNQTVELYFGQRIIRAQRNASSLGVWLDAERRPDEGLQIKKEDHYEDNTAHYKYTLTHSNLKKPIILDINRKDSSVTAALQYSPYPERNLILDLKTDNEMNQVESAMKRQHLTLLRLYRKDGKIDVQFIKNGTTLETESPFLSRYNYSLNQVFQFKWKSDDGTYKSIMNVLKRDRTSSDDEHVVKQIDNFIRMGSNMQTEYMLERNSRNQTNISFSVLFDEMGPKYWVTGFPLSINGKECLVWKLFSEPEGSLSTKLIDACFKRNHGKYEPALTIKTIDEKTLEQVTDVSVTKKVDEDNVYVVTLKWKPGVYEGMIIDFLNFYTKHEKKFKENSKKIAKEFKYQWNTLWPDVHDEMILPFVYFVREEWNRMKNDDEPITNFIVRKINSRRVARRKFLGEGIQYLRSARENVDLINSNKVESINKVFEEMAQTTHLPTWFVMFTKLSDFKIVSSNPSDGEFIFEIGLIPQVFL